MGAGDSIGAKYQIVRELGRGAMGIVYLPLDTKLERDVALKIMLPASVDERSLIMRFLLEARAVAKLRSIHIVHVYDTGTTDMGQPFIAMEYLDGESLGDLMLRERRLEVTAAANYILQACVGLSEAHARGVVHRDLKPSNLFRDRTHKGGKCIKLLAFGIAKSSFEALRVTQHGQRLGTPFYMAPEQYQGAEVDARTDIWALGIGHWALSCISWNLVKEAEHYSGLDRSPPSVSPPELDTGTCGDAQGDSWRVPEMFDEETLLQALVNRIHRGRRLVLLVGSALTAPVRAAPGVPNVDGMVDLVRKRYEGPALSAFDRRLLSAGPRRYQAACARLLATHGMAEVNRVIRQAVLRARANEEDRHIVAGEEACLKRERDTMGWCLSPAVESLGRLLVQGTAGTRIVLTSNFDPLVEVSIVRAPRAHRAPRRRRADVHVDLGRAQGLVTQDGLDGAQRDAGFEQVRRVAVTQRMDRSVFGQAELGVSGGEGLLQRGFVQGRFAARWNEEVPGRRRRPLVLPVVAQASEQRSRQRNAAALCAFAVPHQTIRRSESMCAVSRRRPSPSRRPSA